MKDEDARNRDMIGEICSYRSRFVHGTPMNIEDEDKVVDYINIMYKILNKRADREAVNPVGVTLGEGTWPMDAIAKDTRH